MEIHRGAQKNAVCRLYSFDKNLKKEQGLLAYSEPNSGMHIMIPVVSGGIHKFSDSLAFPHMPGVFDWPSNYYTSPFIPEFTIGDKVFTPSFYGKNLQVVMGTKSGTYHFRYDQPELIDNNEKMSSGIGSMKVDWELAGARIVGRFTLTPKANVLLNNFRLVLPIAAAHSRMTSGNAMTVGQESFRAEVLRDDFHAEWLETKVVSEDSKHRTIWGKVHFYQILERNKTMNLRAGTGYSFEIAYQPDIQRLS